MFAACAGAVGGPRPKTNPIVMSTAVEGRSFQFIALLSRRFEVAA
jgi:hypothetical protein